MRGSREDGLLADAFFQTLFQSSPDAALVTRMRDGAILHVNDEFCHITGFTREEAIGKTALELKLYLNPDDLALLLGKASGGGSLETQLADLRRRDGSKYTAIVSARLF